MQSFIYISVILLWFVVIFQFFAIYSNSKEITKFLFRFRFSEKSIEKNKLQLGSKAPFFRARDQRGNIVKLPSFIGSKIVILFLSETCEVCREVESNIKLIGNDHSITLFLVFLDMNEKHNENIQSNIFYLESQEIFQSYLVETAPTVVMIDIDGDIVRNEPIMNFKQFNILCNQFYQNVS